jgi:hypothetical protein
MSQLWSWQQTGWYLFHSAILTLLLVLIIHEKCFFSNHFSKIWILIEGTPTILQNIILRTISEKNVKAFLAFLMHNFIVVNLKGKVSILYYFFLFFNTSIYAEHQSRCQKCQNGNRITLRVWLYQNSAAPEYWEAQLQYTFKKLYNETELIKILKSGRIR